MSFAISIVTVVVPKFKRQLVEYDLDEVLNEAKLLATEYWNNGGTYGVKGRAILGLDRMFKQEEDGSQLEALVAAMQDQLNLAQKKENARETEWKTWTANLVKSNQEALTRAIGNAEQSRVQLMRHKELYTLRNSLTSAGGSFNPMKGNLTLKGEASRLRY